MRRCLHVSRKLFHGESDVPSYASKPQELSHESAIAAVLRAAHCRVLPLAVVSLRDPRCSDRRCSAHALVTDELLHVLLGVESIASSSLLYLHAEILLTLSFSNGLVHLYGHLHAQALVQLVHNRLPARGQHVVHIHNHHALHLVVTVLDVH